MKKMEQTEYVGFKRLDEILKIKDPKEVHRYAQEAEARLCNSWVIETLRRRYFELLDAEIQI